MDHKFTRRSQDLRRIPRRRCPWMTRERRRSCRQGQRSWCLSVDRWCLVLHHLSHRGWNKVGYRKWRGWAPQSWSRTSRMWRAYLRPPGRPWTPAGAGPSCPLSRVQCLVLICLWWSLGFPGREKCCLWTSTVCVCEGGSLLWPSRVVTGVCWSSWGLDPRRPSKVLWKSEECCEVSGRTATSAPLLRGAGRNCAGAVWSCRFVKACRRWSDVGGCSGRGRIEAEVVKSCGSVPRDTVVAHCRIWGGAGCTGIRTGWCHRRTTCLDARTRNILYKQM